MNNFRRTLGLSLIMIGCETNTTEDKVSQPEEEDSGQSVTAPDDTNSSNDPEDTGEALPEPEDTGEMLPMYCSGASAHVICDPAVNLDLWWEYSGDIRLSTTTGTVLSLPFTTRASEVDGGRLSFTQHSPRIKRDASILH